MAPPATAGRLQRVRHGARVRARILEAMALMTAASAAQKWVPMPRWATALGAPASVPETWAQHSGSVRQAAGTPVEAEVARSIRIGMRHLPWEPTCLAQAVAGQLLLRQRGEPGVVVIGLRPNEAPGAPVDAHAWLMGSAGALTGGVAADGFTAVTVFEVPDGLRAEVVPLERPGQASG